MTFGMGPGEIIGDDEGLSVETSFERTPGAPLMRPPKEALPDRKTTRKDLIKKAMETEAILAQSIALEPDFFDENTGQPQEAQLDITQDAAELLLRRLMDDQHSMALPEPNNPTML